MNDIVSQALIGSEIHCDIVTVIHEIIYLIPEPKILLAAGILLWP